MGVYVFKINNVNTIQLPTDLIRIAIFLPSSILYPTHINEIVHNTEIVVEGWIHMEYVYIYNVCLHCICINTQEAQDEEELNIAPKKVNWDLKRDVEKKLEKLNRRTQRAIVEIIRERLAEVRLSLNEHLGGCSEF